MKVAGFTFIKDALTYDYPIVEAIESILPLCDEFIVAVGNSKDDTLGLIKSIHSQKIRIIETVWDETMREGGRVLAIETDKAFASISSDADWAFYIQGDEVIHEKYHDTIKTAMETHLADPNVDGLLFQYLHFYGSYDFVGSASRWYRHEIRVVKNDKSIFSYRDAQGFRKGQNEKLNVIPIDAFVYHYGWVKDPVSMQRKQENFHKYWHDDHWVAQHVVKANEFDYASNLSYIKPFEGSHPAVMKTRLERKNWKFDFDITFNKPSTKDKLKNWLRKYLGLDFSYKNYRILRR